MYRLFLITSPGLEPIVAKEVRSLGYSSHIGRAMVTVDVGSFDEVMLCNLCLRTPTRVLLHLFDIEAPTKKTLYQEMRRRDWTLFFPEEKTFAIDVPFVQHPEFSHTLYAAQLIKDGICDSLREQRGTRPNVAKKDPDLLFSAVITKKTASLSFDTSGVPLFKRGYRVEHVQAPLRENIAAALLLAADFDRSHILLDPCCGSGTFLIEAALIASQTPPGFLRNRFGFFHHPEFDSDRWKAVRDKQMKQIVPLEQNHFFGIEKDRKSYQLLLRTLSRVGCLDRVCIEKADFTSARLPVAPSFVVANPPYGRRLNQERELIQLYRELGRLCREQTARPCTVGLLAYSPRLAKKVGLPFRRTLDFLHGGLPCSFYMCNL